MKKISIILFFFLVISAFVNITLLNDIDDLRSEIENKQNLLTEKESEISELVGNITSLESEVSSLEDTNYELLEQVNALSEEVASFTPILEYQTGKIEDLSHQVSELQSQVYDLETEKSNLQQDYALLQSSHASLSEQIQELQVTLRLENDLRIGNTLASYYDTVRYGEGYFESPHWWVNYLKNIWQSNINFAAKLSRHDLHRYTWNSYETKYQEAIGEYSYETAWYQLSRIRTHIDIYPGDTSAEKMKKILDFISDNIHYETEVNDIFLAPVETLGFKSGDCDDFTILAATLFECEGIESAIGFFRNADGDYHAMVLVRLDNLGGYSGFRYYSDLTDYGLSAGRWIKIEPQSPIEEQGNDAWMAQWNLDVVAEIKN